MKRKNSPAHLFSVPAGSGSSDPGRIPDLERARYIVGKRPSVNAPGCGDYGASAAMNLLFERSKSVPRLCGEQATMSAARRRRSIAIAVGSGAVHALVLTLVALHAPQLKVLPSTSGPPQAIIPVLIVPWVPRPSAAPGTRPAEIRLHRRPQRFAPIPDDVEPLIIARPTVARPAETDGPRTAPSPPLPDPLTTNARTALRGRVGCANASAVGLTRAEREACEDQFAAGARDAEFKGLGLERGRDAVLHGMAQRREQDYNFKRGILPKTPPPRGAGWDQYRELPGPAAALGKSLNNDRPEATIPF